MFSLDYFVCRFIVHSDANNPRLLSLEKFDIALKSFSPHLIIVSGLHMLDNFPFEPGTLLLHCCVSRLPSFAALGGTPAQCVHIPLDID